MYPSGMYVPRHPAGTVWTPQRDPLSTLQAPSVNPPGTLYVLWEPYVNLKAPHRRPMSTPTTPQALPQAPCGSPRHPSTSHRHALAGTQPPPPHTHTPRIPQRKAVSTLWATHGTLGTSSSTLWAPPTPTRALELPKGPPKHPTGTPHPLWTPPWHSTDTQEHRGCFPTDTPGAHTHPGVSHRDP